MKDLENLSGLIKEKCQFLKERLGHFNQNHFFTSSVVLSGGFKNHSDQIQIGDILSRRIKGNKKENAEYFLIGKIYFNSSPNLNGEIDFIRKYSQNVLIREYLLCRYTLSFEGSKHKMTEETANWEDGIKLITASVNDFEKTPEVFINDRVLKWQDKVKEPS